MGELKTKPRFDFKAIEKSINYSYCWPSYCNENGEFIDFEEEDENGYYSIDNCPLTIDEFESKGYTFGGSTYYCNPLYGDDGEATIHINFYPKHDEIYLEADKYSFNECLTIINMVMAQIKADEKNHCYNLYFGFDGEENEEGKWKGYGADPAMSNYWWDDFAKMFSERIDEIKDVHIYLEENKDEEGDITIAFCKKEE